MILLSTFVYRFLCGHPLSFLLGIPRNGTIGSCVNCAGGLFLFVCLFVFRNCKFQSICTILQFLTI